MIKVFVKKGAMRKYVGVMYVQDSYIDLGIQYESFLNTQGAGKGIRGKCIQASPSRSMTQGV